MGLPFPLNNGTIFVSLHACGANWAMADLFKKVANYSVPAPPICFNSYKGKGLNPELLFALK